MNSNSSHKDLVGKYSQILENPIQLSGAEQLEALKAFVEASRWNESSVFALCY